MTLPEPRLPCQLELLACLHCQGTLETGAEGVTRCNQCGQALPLHEGLLDLRPDPGSTTRLVEHHYNAEHGIDDARRRKLWQAWHTVLQRHGAGQGQALEIGVGSGQLTWGLLHESGFDAVHACDISPRFLHMTAQAVAPAPRPAWYYLCDANQLPFRPNSIDCIVGNSVLHHFIDYERTLACVHATLKPGGLAIFYEPVRQGKAMVSLLLRLLREVDSRAAQPLFTLEQHQKLHHMSRHIVSQAPDRAAVTDREALARREDKYIFDIPSMQALARQLGFASLQADNQLEMDPSYWPNVLQQLLGAGFDRELVLQYRYLFSSVQETLSAMLPDSFTTPMVFLVFRK